jgi:iron complex outermembrane receptor protein
VLASVPGVEVERHGSSSDFATAAIRGATSAQTPVYLAGIRLNDDVTGAADLSTLPLFMIDRVEIYRGNAPLDADQLGIGGAVFFEPRLPKRNELGAGGNVGSFGERGGFVFGETGSERGGALFAFRRDGATNDFPYALDDGSVARRRNADYAATDVWAVARYALGSGTRVTSIVHAYDRDQGSPGFALAENDRARTRTRRLLGAVSARVPCGHGADGAETCSLELSSSVLSGTSALRDPLRLLGASDVETSGERADTAARLHWSASTAWDLAGSVAVAAERIGVEQAESEAIGARRVTVRPALGATLHLAADADLVALGALECETTTGAAGYGSACGLFEPSGRLGARYRLSRAIEVRVNAGRYVRAPTLGELYGVSAVVRGNPGLDAEIGETADAGVALRERAGRIQGALEVFAFARRAHALVAYRQNAFGVITPYNVGAARVLGAEASASLDVSGFVRTQATTTLMDPRDTSPARTVTNDILPFRSRLVVTDLTEIYTTRFLHLDEAALGVRVTHRSSRYADPAGLVVIPEQTVVDLEVSLSFLERRVAVRGALRNVFDAREVDTVGLPLPGRSAHVLMEAFWP